MIIIQHMDLDMPSLHIQPVSYTHLQTKYGVENNSAMFFIADEFEKAQKIAGLVRIELGKRLDLLEKDVYRFCFIEMCIRDRTRMARRKKSSRRNVIKKHKNHLF